MNRTEYLTMAVIFALNAKKSLEDKINERVKNDLDRQILCDRLISQYSFQKIAEKHNYSVDGIKKRFYKAKLKAHI